MNRKDRRVAEAAASATLKHMKEGKYEYGDAPVQANYREQMIAMMSAVNDFVNPNEKNIAVVMMMFPFGDGPGRCNYMSNGVDRKDIVVLMKEMIARFEGMPQGEGHA